MSQHVNNIPSSYLCWICGLSIHGGHRFRSGFLLQFIQYQVQHPATRDHCTALLLTPYSVRTRTNLKQGKDHFQVSHVPTFSV